VDTFSIPQLLRLIATGRLDPSLFATHRFALGAMMEAYDTFGDAANTGALKVVLSASARRTDAVKRAAEPALA
jgi:alcohol dehydrogenase